MTVRHTPLQEHHQPSDLTADTGDYREMTAGGTLFASWMPFVNYALAGRILQFAAEI